MDLASPFRQIVCGALSAQNKSCPADDAAMYTPAALARGATTAAASDAAAAGWSAVETAVSRYQAHPALLGWYVCDDCMTSWIAAQRAAGCGNLDH